MIQSAARITSRLCSITTSEWPAASSLRNARSSLRDVVEMQTGGRFVEQEQRASCAHRIAPGMRRRGKEAGQLQPLRFAAGERWHRLAEVQVIEADVGQRLQHARDVRCIVEERQRIGDRHVEHVGDRFRRCDR